MVAFPRNVAAVTGACLATRRELFLHHHGFDEVELKVGFSDIDYCVRLHQSGYRIAYIPQARLVHKEGQSRGLRINAAEAHALACRTRGLVDPYWNPQFTRESHVPTVSSRRKSRQKSRNRPRRVYLSGDDAFEERTQWELDQKCEIVSDLRDAEVVLAFGWDAANVIRQAHRVGIASLWRVVDRPMVSDRNTPRGWRRLFAIGKTLDDPYQVLFTDPHSRAWMQAGLMRPNARIIEAVVHPRCENETRNLREQSRRELGLSPTDFLLSIEGRNGEDATVLSVLRSFQMLKPALQRRIRMGIIRDTPRPALLPKSASVPIHGMTALQIPAADCLVSQPHETLRGPIVLHALAAGVPIIGTPILESADVMHVGVTGLAVPPLDSARLAEAITQLMVDDRLRAEMGRQARHWLASRSSVKSVRETMWELIGEAAELTNAEIGTVGTKHRVGLARS
jgi:hypothetical protein